MSLVGFDRNWMTLIQFNKQHKHIVHSELQCSAFVRILRKVVK